MKREYLAVGVAILALAGCKAGEEGFSAASRAKGVPAPSFQGEMGGAAPGGMPASEASSVDAAKAAAPEAAQAPALPRKIIYTADVNLICDNLDKAGGAIEAKVKELGGYVSGRQLAGTSGETRTASWTVRVPAEKFEAFLSSVPGMGELQSSNTTSQDVSEEFYDAAARLKNKRVEEERLVQHLKASTGKLSEILTVEKEISRVREEIERVEGRLRYLSNQSDLSTVTIHLSEVRGYVPPKPPGLGTEIARSFTGSIDALGTVLKGLTLAFVALLPWLAILGGMVGGLLYAFKRLGGKKDS